jgi:hypothetical protein
LQERRQVGFLPADPDVLGPPQAYTREAFECSPLDCLRPMVRAAAAELHCERNEGAGPGHLVREKRIPRKKPLSNSLPRLDDATHISRQEWCVGGIGCAVVVAEMPSLVHRNELLSVVVAWL